MREGLLVICIGNTARGDDGVARVVASGLRASGAAIHVVEGTALDIAMAEDIANASSVIIVDAEEREGPLVEERALDATPSGLGWSHGISPSALLALAQSLYGASPKASLLTLAAPAMEHVVGLSETARMAAKEVVASILAIAAGESA